MEEDTNNNHENPLENVVFPDDFTVGDIVGAHGIDDNPTSPLTAARIALQDVEIRAFTGSINDISYGIIHGIIIDPRTEGLNSEAKGSIEFLSSALDGPVIDNSSDVIMALTDQLRAREGDYYFEALDYCNENGLDEARYLRILEHLTCSVELLATWQILREQERNVPITLLYSLSERLREMRAYDLTDIIVKSIRLT